MLVWLSASIQSSVVFAIDPFSNHVLNEAEAKTQTIWTPHASFWPGPGGVMTFEAAKTALLDAMENARRASNLTACGPHIVKKFQCTTIQINPPRKYLSETDPSRKDLLYAFQHVCDETH